LDKIHLAQDIQQAIEGSIHVQESGPEDLGIKKALTKEIDAATPDNIPIASSTSGIPASLYAVDLKGKDRCLVAHPINPPHLIPAVEIVPAPFTREGITQTVKDIMISIDKEPLELKKEIPGFIATRLQEALWREALHMVANDEATPEQIDLALINGPAPRMAYQGQCMAFHVACGEGGMETNLDQFGPALKLPWTRLKAPELSQDLRDKMVDGCKEMSKGKHFLEMAKDRDNAIAAILNAIKNNHPND